jgi:hypothetical protein
MSLGDRGKAVLAVIPATTAGSQLNMVLTDDRGQRIHASRSTCKVSNPGRGLAGSPSADQAQRRLDRGLPVPAHGHLDGDRDR